MANLSLNQNQTFQTPILGQVTLDMQPNAFSAQIWPSSTATAIVAGCAVKLVNTTPGANIIVDVTTSASDGPVFGFIPYNMRKNRYSAGDPVTVIGKDGVLMLKSYAAINRGQALVCINPAALSSDPMVRNDLTVGNYIAGVALGQVAAGSGLLKVMVSPGIVSATGVISVTP